MKVKNKMKAIGIVAEYNPFHAGHRFLIEEAKRVTGAEICVSVMSGNFVQRGEPAVFNKWVRAENAVRQGADLVLELPCVYACASSEYFARGAVSVLEGLGGVSYLAFGSESGNLQELEDCRDCLDLHQEEIADLIREFSRQGMSYPAARENAVRKVNPSVNPDILTEPNNILGLEYIAKVKNMKPVTIKRMGMGYHESASQIRKDLMDSSDEYRKKHEEMEKNFFDLIRTKVLSESCDELEKIASAGEGLSNRMKNCVRRVSSKQEFAEEVKSKRYTLTRINRLLLQTVLGIKTDDIKNASPYVRVLAFNKEGAAFLKQLKKRELIAIPVVDNINKAVSSDELLRKTIEKDVLASDIYNLISGEDLYLNSDYVKKPVFVR